MWPRIDGRDVQINDDLHGLATIVGPVLDDMPNDANRLPPHGKQE
jgi:hypothetical protein